MGTLNQVFNSEAMDRLTPLGIAIKFSASFALDSSALMVA